MLYYLCIPVPSGAPQNLTIINSTSTCVTISWDSVECIHRNGLITHYIISYGPVGDTNLVKTDTVNNDGLNAGGNYMATGLSPSQNHLFEVAAMNDAGMGRFASLSTNKSKLLFIADCVFSIILRIHPHKIISYLHNLCILFNAHHHHSCPSS